MSKHTPGPWTATLIFAGYAPNGYRIEGDGELIARTCTKDEGYDEANANLISAAPELLALAEKIAHGEFNPVSWVQEARAAIAKARGEA